MRLSVFAVIVQLLLPIAARSELLREIPFQYQDGLIWLKVELAGKKEPLSFLLDTGASVSAIDLQTAHTARLHLGERQVVEGVSGKGFAYRVNYLQAMVGGIGLPKSVLAIDLATVSERCHQHIDGILGVDFFRNRIVQIDFKGGKICLLKNCEMNAANCDIVPMRMCNGAFCVPMQIGGNRVQWMRLDTGCDSALEWVVTGMEERPMAGPSIGLSGASVHPINTSARLGRHCFNDIKASIRTKQIFPGEDGLIGNGLLSQFYLTIDERNSRAIFEKAR
jgi:hypothetical protein